MGEILSQEEIDALLRALSSGEVEAEEVKEEERRERTAVKPYDFRRPEKFSKDQIRTLHMIFSAYSRLVSTNLAGFLRSRVQVELISIDQLTYDEFVRSVPNPAFICIFSLLPLEGRCVLQMGLDAVFPMIDRLLGGPGAVPANLRSLTEIENRIMGEVVARMMSALGEAWENIFRIDPRVEAWESNLEFVQVVSGNDMIILFTFKLDMGDKSGMITICIPYIVIEPITQNLSASLWFAGRSTHDVEEVKAKTQKRLERVKLPLIVELGRTFISLRDLLNLELGDVIVLDRRVKEPLEVLVGKKPKMKGVAGRLGNRLAVKILDLKEEPDE
ncbi:MAG: flagellar motor switch protein FliM [Candidatus Atribacteria bacterium]|nr:flagellar motor switch protein FliM [Candidatus Atribacteria bacterium]